jgi:uncharacterized protein (TIGR03435 family)
MHFFRLCALLAATISFDAATVKPSAPQPNGQHRVTMRGGPETPDPGRIAYTNVTLMALLRIAYDALPFRISGPAWLSAQTYDIEATLPPTTTKEQFHRMLADLLSQRFHLTLHHEVRETSGYELVIAKGNPAFTPSTENAESGPGNFTKTDANGFPVLEHPGVAMTMAMLPNAKTPSVFFTARAQSLAGLVQMLAEELRRPVTDRTGLAGKYDYRFEFAPQTGGAPDADPGGDSGPDVFSAVQSQLGLKLIAKKVPVDMLIIDSADKVPTGN